MDVGSDGDPNNDTSRRVVGLVCSLLVVIGAQRREERYDYWQLNRRIMRNGGRDLHVRPGVGISPLRRSPSLWSPAKDG